MSNTIQMHNQNLRWNCRWPQADVDTARLDQLTGDDNPTMHVIDQGQKAFETTPNRQPAGQPMARQQQPCGLLSSTTALRSP